MSIFTIRGVGTVGVVRDLEPEAVPLEAFNAGRNVDFHPSYVARCQGNEKVLGDAVVPPKFLMFWPSLEGSYWIYAGETKIYRISDTSLHVDVSRAVGGVYAAGANTFWTGGVLGGIPFLNYGPSADVPQSYNFTSGKFENLPNWPANLRCNVLRAHKNFLLAGNVQEDTSRYAQAVRWSSPAATGSIPSSWDITNPATLAGEVVLGETPGPVLDIAPLQDFVCVYKSDAVYGMQFTGGNEVFRTWLMHSDVGLLHTGQWANLPVGQIFLTQNDLVLHNGQQWNSVIDRKNKAWFFNNLNPTYYRNVSCTRNIARNEFWLAFPSQESVAGELDRALIWNWADNTFTIRDLDAVSYIIPSTVPSEEGGPEWNTVDETWNAQDLTWNLGGAAATRLTLMTASAERSEFRMVNQGTEINGAAPLGFVERTSMPVRKQDQRGRPALDLATRVLVQRVYPQIESTGPVNLYFGKQDSLTAGVTWQGPYSFNPQTQKKVDLIMNTRFFSYRIEGSNAWKFYGMDIEFTQSGRAL